MNEADLKEIQDLINEKWLNKAIDRGVELYDNVEQTFELNQLLVNAFYQSKQFANAYDYMNDFIDDYVRVGKIELIVDVYLKNRDFIYLRILINSLPASQQKEWRTKVEKAEEAYKIQAPSSVKTATKAFYHVGDQPLAKQNEILESASRLPLANFLTGAKFILVDPYVIPIVKSDIVMIMQQLAITDQVKIQWLDGKTHEIIPENLSSLEKDPIRGELDSLLEKRVGNNQSNLAMLRAELRLQMMVLYPFIDKAVLDPQVWIDGMMQLVEPEVKLKQSATLQWQQKVNACIEEMTTAQNGFL